jgi:cell shape-determining protein MreC
MLNWIKEGLNDIHETVTGARNVKLVQEHLQDTDRLLEACLTRIEDLEKGYDSLQKQLQSSKDQPLEIIAAPVGNQDNLGTLRPLKIMAWLAISLALISLGMSAYIICF